MRELWSGPKIFGRTGGQELRQQRRQAWDTRHVENPSLKAGMGSWRRCFKSGIDSGSSETGAQEKHDRKPTWRLGRCKDKLSGAPGKCDKRIFARRMNYSLTIAQQTREPTGPC